MASRKPANEAEEKVTGEYDRAQAAEAEIERHKQGKAS